ncbi:MAG TPA: Holliday junction resolvase RuvX [Vicinamibacterales bacterium]|nr:Holliday junction resolvase RuvX [Vicinamibacterales bacterium]
MDRSGRIAAIDVGARRIGLAVSDATGTLARPLTSVVVRPEVPAVASVAAALRRLADEEDGLAAIVVGLPRRLDGRPTDQTAGAQAFAAALGRLLDRPIVFQDERLSSREAESRLAHGERDWRKRKARLDAAAAAVILQDYLDGRHERLRLARGAGGQRGEAEPPSARERGWGPASDEE